MSVECTSYKTAEPFRMERLCCYTRKDGELMARPRKFRSPKALEEKWEEFKEYCNNRTVLSHEFSSKNSEFVSAELKRSVTYTIEGFCVYSGIARQDFYATYGEDKRFCDIVTRMKEECEADAREKFELGVIPSQLAGLWMSKYGYSTRQDVNAKVEPSEKLADVMAQIGGEGLEE